MDIDTYLKRHEAARSKAALSLLGLHRLSEARAMEASLARTAAQRPDESSSKTSSNTRQPPST